MASKIFLNLPVANLERSIEFFTHLGFRFNPQFTDDKATCMVISEQIYVMLLTGERFRDFTTKEICDTETFAEMIVAIDAENREAVDETVDKAMAAGGLESSATQDYGWMYVRSFQDLDGHLWEVLYIDESAVPEG
ncbi:VOC family protein [Pollutibacter soli]|uniref:VOC family protein n=1 Tax=Pollutibacter soli TaxID=3034157 RepID=UPI0030140A23